MMSGQAEHHASAPVYNVLHPDPLEKTDDDHIDHDHEDDEHDHHIDSHKHHMKREVLESFDFNDCESMMWRKVSLSHF